MINRGDFVYCKRTDTAKFVRNTIGQWVKTWETYTRYLIYIKRYATTTEIKTEVIEGATQGENSVI